MRFLPVNLHSFLIELTSLEESLALYDSLCATPLPGIEDMLPAARTLLIRVSRMTDCQQLMTQISRRSLNTRTTRRQSRIVIPVRYNGEDLPEVAAWYGLTVQALIARHQQAVWKVAFMGFAPGFAYLVSRDADWQTPRRATPRTRIPPGSLALAGEFSGIYPQASPGGWQLIGQTACRMWDSRRQPPALLQAGAQVQFVDEHAVDEHAVDQCAMHDQSIDSQSIHHQSANHQSANHQSIGNQSAHYQSLNKQGSGTLISLSAAPPAIPTPAIPSSAIPSSAIPTPAAPEAAAGRGDLLLNIVSPGLQTSWQDNGRAGGAAMGVAESGAMDKAAWRAANWLVGNPSATPCLEITQGGFHAVAQRDLVMALSGAPCPVTLIVGQARYPLPFAAPFSLAAGDEIMLGAPLRGVRSYLAIRGGCLVERFLGSASWDSLAKVGQPPLSVGDRLWAAPPVPLLAVQTAYSGNDQLPDKSDTVTLDVLAGPRTDWFTDAALITLSRERWRVTPQSDRIGLRLQGATPLARAQLQELPSEGTCSGAIQVPASGQPVLFLHDHPLTGGYPVIAAVADYHLDLAGQIPPGVGIHFRIIRSFQVYQGSSVADV